MGARSFALVAAAMIIGVTTASAVALAPNERGRERIAGDDDPIIVSRSVAEPEKRNLTLHDPETTGSVASRAASKRRDCERFAFFPDRPPGQQLREAC